jgi:hypothetical protein
MTMTKQEQALITTLRELAEQRGGNWHVSINHSQTLSIGWGIELRNEGARRPRRDNLLRVRGVGKTFDEAWDDLVPSLTRNRAMRQAVESIIGRDFNNRRSFTLREVVQHLKRVAASIAFDLGDGVDYAFACMTVPDILNQKLPVPQLPETRDDDDDDIDPTEVTWIGGNVATDSEREAWDRWLVREGYDDYATEPDLWRAYHLASWASKLDADEK